MLSSLLYCSKCTFQHLRPVGKKCQYEGESFASDVEDAAPPSMYPASVATVSDKILLQLQRLGEKMDSMDRMVQRTDAIPGQGSQQANSSSSTSHGPPV